ncbi:MAG: ABC transporter substrate-binding protein [Chloroflexota bacterium]|mgnify:CR=1 FL=1
MLRRPGRILLCLVLGVALAGCEALGGLQPTPPPIILIATPTPEQQGPAATEAPAQPATPAPAATEAAPQPAATPAPDATAAPPEQAGGTVTFAFDSFPSYFPGVIAEVRGLLAQRGYELELVPFGLDGNDFSEAERFERLRSGEWDVLATTLDGFARQGDPAIGAITALVDESAGADKLVAAPGIATINDLRGKRVAYSEGSVGEFFLYYALSLAGLGPGDVTLVARPTVAEAVAAYTSGEADAVSAWEPDVLAAEEQGAQVLIASDKLRAILDVLVTSRQSIESRPAAVQAFHEAWFEALKLMIDSPADAEQAIIEWGNTDWSLIAAPGDLTASLESLAQATLGANQIAFRSPDVLVSRIAQAQDVWRRAGQSVPEADLAQLIDGRFVAASAQDPGLFSTQPPANSSFLLTSRIDLPQLSQQEQQQTEAVVQLPIEKIDFEPDSLRLTEQAQRDLIEQVLPVLRSSTLYLKIEGSSAWPGPEGRFTAEEIRAFARDRATSVATFLSQQGINPNRFIIGTLEPKYPNSINEAELAQDRIVRFTLVTLPGR